MKKLLNFSAAIVCLVMVNTAVAAPLLTATTTSIAVHAAPPPAVLSSFNLLFGNAPVREWKLRSDGNWRAHFTNNGVAWEATFTPGGTLVKSEPK